MSRPIIIAGNWKMNLLAKEASSFIKGLLSQIQKPSCKVYIAPSYTSIASAKQTAPNWIQIGAQNMNEHEKGAYTGEISTAMLKEAGATFVIIGHSERRHLFSENDEVIHRKAQRALEENLEPILCIGETQEERDQEKTQAVLERQLREGLKGFSKEQLSKMIIAYEPVWAIGTGKTATPEMAGEAHALCRHFLTSQWGKETAEKIPILYGGSVKPDTITALLKEPDIDGALIGGASIQVESFAQIINNAEEMNQ